MTATAIPVSRKRTSAASPSPCRPNARRVRKLGRKTRQTNCSNIFRWYRAGWGRYTQADPIGLRGGANLYAYGRKNPVVAFDRLGLTVWNCTVGMASGSSPIGPGAMVVGINCESECPSSGSTALDVWLLGSAVGLSAGLPAGATGFKATVEDSDSAPSADSLAGKFFYGSVGAAIGIGPSYSQIIIGSAKSKPGWGASAGVSAGADVYVGATAVVSSKPFTCCKK